MLVDGLMQLLHFSLHKLWNTKASLCSCDSASFHHKVCVRILWHIPKCYPL